MVNGHITGLGMCLGAEGGDVTLDLLQALRWAQDLGLHNVIFELDAKIVVAR